MVTKTEKKVSTKKTAKATTSKPKQNKASAKIRRGKEEHFVALEHDLLTTAYTTVLHEKDYKFNAPHTVIVIHSKPESVGVHKGHNFIVAKVHFQEGPIKENGVNGIANEDALAMVLCRLENFQESEYKCRENAVAITKIEEALMWLRKRTNKRVKRNVEGTSKV